MKKLSIVIPCYNCSKTIGRLLDSVLDNQLNKEDYEVIVCDDKSTDNFLDIVKSYEDKMNIVYCETTREVHCPGNTRQAALPYITGEWFTFIDNDDMFEPDVLKLVLHYIRESRVEYTLSTNIREFNITKGEYTKEIKGDDADTWLHGKFFNKKNTLDVFGCRFKDDMMSHEDLYFNSSNLEHLIAIGKDYDYLPIFTYKWIRDENNLSLSRSYYNEKFNYIDTYFEDYLIGASYPFFELAGADDEQQRSFAINQVMMTLLHGYFYFQSLLWREGKNEVLNKNYIALKKLKEKIAKEFNLSNVNIIDYINRNPERYMNIKIKCFYGAGGPFVEIQSFTDFILNLN